MNLKLSRSSAPKISKCAARLVRWHEVLQRRYSSNLQDGLKRPVAADGTELLPQLQVHHLELRIIGKARTESRIVNVLQFIVVTYLNVIRSRQS